jgi:hypothetical protein
MARGSKQNLPAVISIVRSWTPSFGNGHPRLPRYSRRVVIYCVLTILAHGNGGAPVAHEQSNGHRSA